MTNEDDCDDGEVAIHPGAPEDCEDTVDNDCDNLVDCDDDECADLVAGLSKLVAVVAARWPPAENPRIPIRFASIFQLTAFLLPPCLGAP